MIEVPWNIFSAGRTHCPSCNGTLAEPTNRCPLCGFTAQICVQRYPFEPPPLDRFVDAEGLLSATDKRTMERAIDWFEKRFPQITISACLTRLPKGVDGREFGFWLFNRSTPVDDEQKKQRDHTLLIVIDFSQKTISATVGYGLDCFLDDVVLSKSLDDAKPTLRKKGFAAGIARWLKLLSSRLVIVHDDAHYAADRYVRRGAATSADKGGAIGTVQPVATPSPQAAATPAAVSQGYRELSGEPMDPVVQPHPTSPQAEVVGRVSP